MNHNKTELKQLIGRSDDLILLPSGKKAAGLTFYYVTKSVIKDDGNVKEFVIEQHNPNDFLISYISNKAMTESKKAIIRTEIENYLEPGLNIKFKKLEQLQRSASGKLKQFNRLF
jgi:phenylacetate-CoA ligase